MTHHCPLFHRTLAQRWSDTNQMVCAGRPGNMLLCSLRTSSLPLSTNGCFCSGHDDYHAQNLSGVGGAEKHQFATFATERPRPECLVPPHVFLQEVATYSVCALPTLKMFLLLRLCEKHRNTEHLLKACTLDFCPGTACTRWRGKTATIMASSTCQNLLIGKPCLHASSHKQTTTGT